MHADDSNVLLHCRMTAKGVCLKHFPNSGSLCCVELSIFSFRFSPFTPICACKEVDRNKVEDSQKSPKKAPSGTKEL